jgi:hypothetical protein
MAKRRKKVDVNSTEGLTAYVLAKCNAIPKCHFWPNPTTGIPRRNKDGSIYVQRAPYKGAGDIIGCSGGRHIEIEIKNQVTGDRQQEHQLKHQEAIEKAKGFYFIVTSADQFHAEILRAIVTVSALHEPKFDDVHP